jgi:hypothetical protein
MRPSTGLLRAAQGPLPATFRDGLGVEWADGNGQCQWSMVVMAQCESGKGNGPEDWQLGSFTVCDGGEACAASPQTLFFLLTHAGSRLRQTLPLRHALSDAGWTGCI